MRWFQIFWSRMWLGRPDPPPKPPRPREGGPEGAPLMPPPRFVCVLPAPIRVCGALRPVGKSFAFIGVPPRPPVRVTGGRPAASRSLSCLRRRDSVALLYLDISKPVPIQKYYATGRLTLLLAISISRRRSYASLCRPTSSVLGVQDAWVSI